MGMSTQTRYKSGCSERAGELTGCVVVARTIIVARCLKIYPTCFYEAKDVNGCVRTEYVTAERKYFRFLVDNFLLVFFGHIFILVEQVSKKPLCKVVALRGTSITTEMESRVYKEAVQSLHEEGRSSECDMSDDEHVHCEACGADETYSFYRRESFGPRDSEEYSRYESEGEKDDSNGKRTRKDSLPNKIKWADECNKELARRNPRKKYTKKPIQLAPLKSILKPN